MNAQETANETWKQIWVRKGKAEGNDLLSFDGYEATQVDMKEVALQITKRLNIQKGDKVLEVGCGAGAIAQYLDCDYTGIDYSHTLVKKHIEILHNSVLTGEAADLPFKDHSFDKVICYGVYLYFDDKEYAKKATSELLRVARKSVLIGELPIILEKRQIPAIKFMEAKELISKKFNRSIADYDDFEPEEEKLLSQLIKEETGSDFVFVTHYPSRKRPFYAMDSKENQEETESFDLLFKGLEITTGGQRIHSYEDQLNKMRSRGMNTDLFESYLMMHKYGMPPHGGLGLGLERFTGRLLDQENVRLSSLFPRDLNRVTP